MQISLGCFSRPCPAHPFRIPESPFQCNHLSSLAIANKFTSKVFICICLAASPEKDAPRTHSQRPAWLAWLAWLACANIIFVSIEHLGLGHYSVSIPGPPATLPSSANPAAPAAWQLENHLAAAHKDASVSTSSTLRTARVD